MGKLGLTESGENVLFGELKELCVVELENQRLMLALGEENKIERRSAGQLLHIAIRYTVEGLRKENEERMKELEAKGDVGGKHIHTDRQNMPQDAR